MATIQINTKTLEPERYRQLNMTEEEMKDFFLYVAMCAEDAGHDFRYVDAVSIDPFSEQFVAACLENY